MIVGYLSWLLAIVVLLIFSHLLYGEWRFKHGYLLGRRDEANWWITAEEKAEAELVQMWRDHLKKSAMESPVRALRYKS